MWKRSSVTLLAILVVWSAAISCVSTFDGKIVNGTLAQDGEFPFMVSLRRASSGRHSCGASLLNRIWVLTAAHCVKRAQPHQINIQFASNTLDPNSTNVANVSKIFVHEGYNASNQYINDIALMRLSKPVQMAKDFVGIRLPEHKAETREDTPALLIGWGLNATGGVVQKHLQKVDLTVFSDKECSRRHNLTIHPSNICAGVPEGGKGQCSGDSGGPLIVNGTQVGIVSWSRKPCTIAPFPGVFTEVSAYIGWILETILDAEDEEKEEKELNSEEGVINGMEGLQTGNLIVLRVKNPLGLKNVSLRSVHHGNQHICAGSILNPQWILTAAHCFTFLKVPKDLLIQYGSNELNPAIKQYKKIQKIIIHPGYNPTVILNDIAIVQLETAIGPEQGIEKVQLGTLMNYENVNVKLLGWGLNETFGVLSPKLQKVSLKTITLTECRSVLQSFVGKFNLCAGGFKSGQCSGDSGGPLMWENKQIGLVSWSLKPCGSKPGVFTNITYYLNWIKEIIEKE